MKRDGFQDAEMGIWPGKNVDQMRAERRMPWKSLLNARNCFFGWQSPWEIDLRWMVLWDHVEMTSHHGRGVGSYDARRKGMNDNPSRSRRTWHGILAEAPKTGPRVRRANTGSPARILKDALAVSGTCRSPSHSIALPWHPSPCPRHSGWSCWANALYGRALT